MINNKRTHQPFATVGEEGYLDLLQHVLSNGYEVDNDRTGVGTIVSPTPHQLYFPNVDEKFPLFTTKYVSFNMLACEMLWIIAGSTNANDIKDIGSPAMSKMWHKWADNNGGLGPVYGKQARFWETKDGKEIDQLENAINDIKNNSTSRRIRVTHWNPGEIQDAALPPCHVEYQFTCQPLTKQYRINLFKERVDNTHRITKNQNKVISELLDSKNIPKYKLHLHLLCRSQDLLLGTPFNIAQYALLLLLVAKVTNTQPGGFTWTGINCHIYQNHIRQVNTQLNRDPYKPPQVQINDKNIESIDDFTINHIRLKNYNHQSAIEAPVAI